MEETTVEVEDTKVKKAKGGQNFNELTVTMFGKTYSWKSLPDTQKNNCGVYGLALKLGRSTAGMNADTHTDIERSTQVDATYNTLKDNNWNKPGTGGGGGIKKAELQATVTAQRAKLDDMGIKLVEAMALVEKLTAKAE